MSIRRTFMLASALVTAQAVIGQNAKFIPSDTFRRIGALSGHARAAVRRGAGGGGRAVTRGLPVPSGDVCGSSFDGDHDHGDALDGTVAQQRSAGGGAIIR